MEALNQPSKFIHKFIKLVQDDIKAKQGVGYNSIGQYHDTHALIGLINPETEQAKKILAKSLLTFNN